jgi:dihydrofolate reductase
MPRKLVVFIAASLDGYIATIGDKLDWLVSTPGDGDNGYSAFLSTVDTIVMGRRTYDWIIAEEGRENFPYRGYRCYVVTSTPAEPDENVVFISEDLVAFARRLKAEEGRNIWVVGGGKAIKDLRENRLIDEWIVTFAPVLLGDGIPLFYTQDEQERLYLTDVKRYGQFATLHYRTRLDEKV